MTVIWIGGFLAGLVVPREGGLAITLTEKLEDMVSIIFLPLVRPSLLPNHEQTSENAPSISLFQVSPPTSAS